MSKLSREHAIVIRITEVSDLAEGGIQVIENLVASNVMNRDELIGILTRAIWAVGHGDDKQIPASSLHYLTLQLPPVEPPAEG